jgi:uncharacterized protein YbaP (TraB family)
MPHFNNRSGPGRSRDRGTIRRIVSLLALWCCAGAAVAAQPPAVDGRLWRIAKAGVPDSYVLGTIHVAEPDVAALSAPVRAALARSRTLATELPFEALSFGPPYGLDPALSTADDAAARLPVDDTLSRGADLERRVGGPAFARLVHRLRRDGLAEHDIRRMKPWEALLRVTRDKPADAPPMLDEALVAAARELRIRVVPLEGVDDQIAAFDMVPVIAQAVLLSHALMHPDALDAARQRALDAWRRGDLARLASANDAVASANPALREAYAALDRHVIVNRTAVMHHRLFLPLMRGGLFVAVGASHLPGKEGLLSLLREDGYRVTRVW